MKKIFYSMLLAALCCWAATAVAQTVKVSNSTTGGLWSDGATWQGGVAPGATDSVVIRSGDSVVFHQTPSVPATCRSLTLLSGSQFYLSMPADTLYIDSTLTIGANATFYDSSYTGNLPGKYVIIDHASTVVYGSSTVGSAKCHEFGNVLVRRAAGSTCGAELEIFGDLTINNNGPSNVFRGIDKNVAGSYHHIVHGNVTLIKGGWSAVDLGSDSTVGCTWEVMGNVLVQGALLDDARMGNFSSAGATGYAEFDIHGNLTLGNGGRLQAGTSSTHATGTAVITLHGDFNMQTGSKSTSNTNSIFCLRFVKNGTQTVKLDTNFSMQALMIDTVFPGSHVVMDFGTHYWKTGDTGVVYGGRFTVLGTLELKDSSELRGAGTFELKPGATLMIGSPKGIRALPDSVNGNIRYTVERIFDPSASYVYNGNSAQQTGDGLPVSLASLTVDNPSGVELDTSIAVSGALNIVHGTFNASNDTVALGSGAVLAETDGNTVAGTVTATRTVGASATETFGGMGATLTTGAVAPGVIAATRWTGIAQTGAGHSSILRAFDLAPAVNSGLNAQLKFTYDASELNGQNATNLLLFHSQDGGTTWSYQFSTNNTGTHSLTATGLDALGRFSASDDANPLGEGVKLLAVASGWNMVSLPVTAANHAKSVLFPTATSNAFAYSHGYVAADSLQNGAGYWLKFGVDQTAIVSGFERLSDTIHTNQGWNMIGSISKPVAKLSIVQFPLSSVISPYYRYSNGYFSSDSLIPGKAYWVKTSAAGTLTLTASPSAKPIARAENPFDGFSSVTFTDKTGNAQTLYVGSTDQTVDMAGYEMPPAPPEGIFDVRFASQRIAENAALSKSASFPVVISSAVYPVTVSWNVKRADARLGFAAGSVGQNMSGNGSMVIASPSKNPVITVTGTNPVPAEFSLSRNYPNPFNPSTSIRIGLPAESQVSIRVFNVLGQEVARIAAGQMAAGFHSLTWNGTDDRGTQVGSGVYFYRMDATSVADGSTFSEVKRMVLMK